ncbi:conserved hypothetical protein [Catenulispora acidiphila DSM 44928]|uniref:Copper transporter n=1 Tax=Catenulispora acidiphila (strain DSM 44928 / JCM 14897 / NBRC 102108 / NRRL B-24433 / ID139908) TaxID=479433 RepID=C7Q9C8_CATAD|nr:copper transporter [Catenulispora acidiphila]ACU74274.1 conserved hypothetical protein [Catenulispora acidiphila DSM 44928]
MIDFRYHVVSIVAVFLALTVGLVIGSSYLSKVAYDELNNQLASLRSQNQALHGTQNELSAQVRDRNSLIAALGPDAVAGKLAGHSVAVVILPGADGSSGDAMADLLAKSGAVVTGEVTLKSALLDPGQAGKLAAAGAKLPADERGGEQLTSPSSSASGATPSPVIALADIAGAVVHRIPASTSGIGEQHITDQASQDVLTAYSDAGFLDVKSASTSSADLVVVMSPAAPSSGSAANDAADALYLGFLKDLTGGGRSLGAVLAGPASSAASPGLLAAAQKDSWVSKNVSTADTADQASGRIITVFALAEAASGKTGHYGLTGTADGPLPDLH